MSADKTLELAALALCEHRKQEPYGKYTVSSLRGTKIVRLETTFLEQAREDAKVVLDAAVPGLLVGAVTVIPADYNEGF